MKEKRHFQSRVLLENRIQQFESGGKGTTPGEWETLFAACRSIDSETGSKLELRLRAAAGKRGIQFDPQGHYTGGIEGLHPKR